MLYVSACAHVPPLPLFNFIKHKRGGTVPPRKNCGGTIPPHHKRVPLFHKPPVFTRRDGPASAHLRPAFSQTTSFYEAGRSRLVPPVHKHFVKTVVGRSRLITKAERTYRENTERTHRENTQRTQREHREKRDTERTHIENIQRTQRTH